MSSGNGRAVFLDRDGVINRAVVRNGRPHPPDTLEELEIVPGAKEALAKLKARGFALLVITNQPDVARGKQSGAVVEAINARLLAELPLDRIYTCFHDDTDNCACRKPNPGLILMAAEEWAVNPAASYLVGDRWKDIVAGQRAGCTTLFIDYGYTENNQSSPRYQVLSLAEAVELILKLEEKQE